MLSAVLRVILALLCLTALCAFGRLTGVEFVSGPAVTVGSFITLNVMQKNAEAKK